MSTKQQIADLLRNKGEMSVAELADQLAVSRQMVHRSLRTMLEANEVERLGRPPKTYYRITVQKILHKAAVVNAEEAAFLQEHFLVITETGVRLEGIDAMKFWCERQKLPIQKTIIEFIQTQKKYLKYFDGDGLIHGMEKINSTKGFKKVHLDDLYYFDFYAIERFGKTKLGTLLHYAKQGQNKSLMQEVVNLTNQRLNNLVQKMNIDGVGYIPPTIKRDVQIMKFFEVRYNLPLPHLGLKKISGDIIVPQKALNKIEDRINNAKASIIVSERRAFKKILLIDDAVGSGATINETAGKIKAKGISEWVAGVAVTGSFKGFDVIQEI